MEHALTSNIFSNFRKAFIAYLLRIIYNQQLLPNNTKRFIIIYVPQVLFDSAYQEPQLLHSVNKVEVKALICAEFFKSNSCYQILRDLIPELDGYPESGVEIKGSKTPSLRTLIIMSDKHYR